MWGALCMERRQQASVRVLSRPENPDRFLAVVRAKLNGLLRIGVAGWRSRDTWLIAFSENGAKQEAMLLMPAHGWIHTSLGHFVLEPEVGRPWTARLLLVSSQQECTHALSERNYSTKRHPRLPSAAPGP